jgi:hypothetical protein
MNIDFNERAKIVHANNGKWWIDLNTGERIDRNKGEMLMLVVTELAEAAEGLRKNLMDDHLPHRSMVEVELADAEIRLLDFAGGFGYNINSEIINDIYNETPEEAMDYFDVRPNKLEALFDVTKAVASWNDETTIGDIIFEIRLFAHVFGYDIEGSYHEKNEYNKTRKDHSIEERLKPNGKKY